MSSLRLQVALLVAVLARISAFTGGAGLTFPVRQRCASIAAGTSTSLYDDDTAAPTLDDIPRPLQPFFDSIINATAIRGADTSNQGHDSFRYEWGTWVVDSSLQHLMEQVDRMRLQQGAYEALVQNDKVPVRLRVGGGADWDCILHILPAATEWQGRWPTGSWAILKALTGMIEVGALSGPDRDGRYKAKTSKSLRGGSDGSLGSGMSTGGAACIKYVGGPLRCYRGQYGKSALLEVVVRPPIGLDGVIERMDSLNDLESVLAIAEEVIEVEGTLTEPSPAKTIESNSHLRTKLGTEFEKVGGLDKQLDAIARRVLASRANPAAARRLGVSHVRGILLSGPPGCGKTLLARELSILLGAREPVIVNGPEILNKFIGEAEKKVRELFLPAEQEYKAVGDDSALHIIILDEMDAIARKRGTMTADTTGVRDSVVNQLLAKMDGVKEASNILVVGLTNRPELLDPALLRPGRLEVQLRIGLPDLEGRRAILRIHTRQMKEVGGLSGDAVEWIEDMGENGLPAITKHYSGAELAGLVRSAASFALGRTMTDDEDAGVVSKSDLKESLKEVRAALGKQDELLKPRYPLGISLCSTSMRRITRDLERFTRPLASRAPRLQSLLLVGSGGTGVTSLAAWAATGASENGSTDYVRFISALDLIVDGGNEAARSVALAAKFDEAREMEHALLILDDVDQLCAGSSPAGYSSVMIATLRALLRSPPPSNPASKAVDADKPKLGKSIHVIATSSRADAACSILYELFDDTIVVPPLYEASDVAALLVDTVSLAVTVENSDTMAAMILQRLGNICIKAALRIVERAVAEAATKPADTDASTNQQQLLALDSILDDMSFDRGTTQVLCQI